MNPALISRCLGPVKIALGNISPKSSTKLTDNTIAIQLGTILSKNIGNASLTLAFNNKRVTIPSFSVLTKDIICVRKKSLQHPVVLETTDKASKDIPDYIELLNMTPFDLDISGWLVNGIEIEDD